MLPVNELLLIVLRRVLLPVMLAPAKPRPNLCDLVLLLIASLLVVLRHLDPPRMLALPFFVPPHRHLATAPVHVGMFCHPYHPYPCLARTDGTGRRGLSSRSATRR